MSIDTVRTYFKQWNKEDAVREFAASSATVELAARAVGVVPARIAKTLAFSLDGGCLLLVAAGDARIDNAKFKKAFGGKARMLPPEETLAATGHPVGGVCPFALPDGVQVRLDVSLRRFATIFPACGSANSAIELTCDELAVCSRSGGWTDVCKDWDPGAG